ncbi:MAG: DNA topoisomerase, partial [Chlamydiota bacterium]
MKVVLAEKPSVARDIAAHLGANQKYDGYFQGNDYQVTWAFGHLISLKNPEDYDPALKRWSLSTIPFIPKAFELKVVDDKGIRKQFATIKKLLKAADELICATDAGREGELIFRYILTMTECEKKPWKRLWLSSLTDEAIRAAFQNLKPGSDYNNLYAAARCRSEADWIVGLNATRNLTVRYGAFKTLWSVGRVQTPVLAMIARRDDEIRHFKPEAFWELFTKYNDVDFKFKGDRFTSKEAAEVICNKIKDHPLMIEKVTSKNENEHPPLLYDLTELQRDMNRKFGMSAADTLQIAQTLYEQKLITYPRTDSRYLTADMKGQVTETLGHLKQIKGKEIELLDLGNLSFSNRIINDKKVTDHHAIIPTGKGLHNVPPQSR